MKCTTHRIRGRDGDAAGPQADVLLRVGGDWSLEHDVGRLESPAGPKHAVHLGNSGGLVGHEIEDPVRDHDVGPACLDRQGFQQPLTELDVGQVGLRRVGSCRGEHLRGHVDADDVARRADQSGGDERVGPRTGTAIDDALAVFQGSQSERIAGPRHRNDGSPRKNLDPLWRIAEDRRQAVPRVEVEAAAGFRGDGRVLRPDRRSQRVEVNGRRLEGLGHGRLQRAAARSGRIREWRRRAITAYDMPIEGRDEWLAAASRLLA